MKNHMNFVFNPNIIWRYYYEEKFERNIMCIKMCFKMCTNDESRLRH